MTTLVAVYETLKIVLPSRSLFDRHPVFESYIRQEVLGWNGADEVEGCSVDIEENWKPNPTLFVRPLSTP